MKYKLPNGNVYQREDYVVEKCRGQRVLHLGAVQANDDIDIEKFDAYAASPRFLHKRICEGAANCVGLDYNAELTKRLEKKHGIGGIYVCDLEDKCSLPKLTERFDVIVMGELIEHLGNPLQALTHLRKYMHEDTVLIITTPNALRSSAFLYAFFGFEAHDEDHVAIYSPRLLEAILLRAGMKVDWVEYYESSYSRDLPNRGVQKRLKSVLFRRILRAFIWKTSAFADGLIVIARPQF